MLEHLLLLLHPCHLLYYVLKVCKLSKLHCAHHNNFMPPAYVLQEWGQVLIEVKYAPVTPADIYTVRLGGMYDEDSKEPPFVAGHDAVAVVAKVSAYASAYLTCWPPVL
jgi:hypothetical protein